MSVRIIPFEDRFLDATVELMRRWAPEHPELSRPSLFRWQRCNRFLAVDGDRIVGHIAQLSHEFRYADGRASVKLGWGITLVLDMSDDAVRKAAGRALLSACEDAPELRYAAVGVVPAIEPAYLRRGHQLTRAYCSYFGRFFAPRKVLAYWGKAPVLAPVLSLGNVIMRHRTRPRHGELEQVRGFQAEWDPVWDRLLRADYELFGRRDADFLNYKLAQPDRDYRAFVHRDRTGDLDGFVVYRRARHNSRDMDLVKICAFVGTRSAKEDMFGEAIRFAREEAEGTYGVVGLSAQSDAAAFRSAGLYLAKPYPIVVAAGVAGRIRVDFFDSDLDDLW
jgi:hypothetical protein